MISNKTLTNNKICILNILEETAEKAKISNLVPRFINDGHIAIRRLKGTEFHKCAEILRAYINDDKAKLSNCPTQYQERCLLSLIDVLQANYKMLRYFPDWLDNKISPLCDEFYVLKNTAKEHFQKNAVEQLIEEKELSLIFHQQKPTREDIKKLDRVIAKKRISLKYCQSESKRKQNLIEMEGELQRKTKIHNEFRWKEETKCLDRYDRYRIDFNGRKKLLLENAKETLTNLEKTTESNARKENDVRGERNKFLLQYQALLKKYDQHMAEKIMENMRLDEEMAKLTESFEMFMKFTYSPVEKRYNRIIEAKERKEREKFLAEVHMFTMNHAARIIQRAYREYLRKNKPEFYKETEDKDKKKGYKKKTIKRKK